MQTIIKMNNKSLQVTSLVKTYQNEHNADELLFLLPPAYGSLNISDCSITVYWENQNGQGGTIPLLFDADELYNDTYLQAYVPLVSTFTQISGDIELYLKIVNGENEVVLKTNKVKFPIHEHEDSDTVIPEGELSIVGSLNMQVQLLDAEIQRMYTSRPTIEEIEALFLDMEIQNT